MIRYLRRLFDAERCRQVAIGEVFALRGQLEYANDQLEQFRAANALLEGQVRRERSMLNDQWAACQRVEMQRDYWRREAEVLGERLQATYVVADGLHLANQRLREERDAVTPAPLRVVKGGKR